MQTVCTHLARVRPIVPRTRGCSTCLESGGSWVHLRLCLDCGFVGCCNRSDGRHAMRHFLETGHPLMQSLEPMDEWAYCWADEIFVLPQITLHCL